MSAKIPPKPTKDVIYIDVDDEITSIIDKIENSEHKVVALVLPKRASSLQSIVNMKLLKRSADIAGKNPVLITSEASLLPLVGAAGLHAAKNLQSKPEIPDAPSGLGPVSGSEPESETPDDTDELGDETDADNEEDLPAKIDYGKPVGALAAVHEAENTETINLDDEDEAEESDDKPEPAGKQPKSKKVKVPNFDRFRMLLGLGILAVIALIVFIVMAIFVLPKATVTIQTTSEPVSSTFTLAASSGTTAVDSAKGAIPAKLESSDQTGNQQVTATGQQNNGQKATGSVVLSAGTCGPNFPSDIPAGTGVSANGVTFITQEAASFSAKNSGGHCVFQSQSVDMNAQAAGSKYNVNSDSFSVAGYSGVTGSGSASGGTDSIVTILIQSDVDGASQKLTTGTTADTFIKALEAKLAGQGEYVLTSTLKVGDPVITSNPAVGQPANTASVSIKITYTVLTVKNTDLSQVIEDKLASQIDKTKQKLNGNFLNDAAITVQNQPSANAANLNVNEDTTAVPIIDVATVKKQSEGKKVGDIQTAIGNWPGVKSVNVALGPFWVSKVPNKPSKITVVLQEVKTSTNNNSGP